MGRNQPEEDLSRVAEWAAEHIPDDMVPQPAPDEFERIWKRIQEVKENEDQ